MRTLAPFVLLAALVAVATAPRWGDPIPWTPDGLYYEAQTRELEGEEARAARACGLLERSSRSAASTRAGRAARAPPRRQPGAGSSTAPSSTAVAGPFRSPRLRSGPSRHARSIQIVSLLGYAVFGLTLFALLRRSFGRLRAGSRRPRSSRCRSCTRSRSRRSPTRGGSHCSPAGWPSRSRHSGAVRMARPSAPVRSGARDALAHARQRVGADRRAPSLRPALALSRRGRPRGSGRGWSSFPPTSLSRWTRGGLSRSRSTAPGFRLRRASISLRVTTARPSAGCSRVSGRSRARACPRSRA